MQGSPFDQEINALYQDTLKQMKKTPMPVVTVLQARAGKIIITLSMPCRGRWSFRNCPSRSKERNQHRRHQSSHRPRQPCRRHSQRRPAFLNRFRRRPPVIAESTPPPPVMTTPSVPAIPANPVSTPNSPPPQMDTPASADAHTRAGQSGKMSETDDDSQAGASATTAVARAVDARIETKSNVNPAASADAGKTAATVPPAPKVVETAQANPPMVEPVEPSKAF